MCPKFPPAREEGTYEQPQPHTDLEKQYHICVAWGCGTKKAFVQCTGSVEKLSGQDAVSTGFGAVLFLPRAARQLSETRITQTVTGNGNQES